MCVTRLQLVGFRMWLKEVMGFFQATATNSVNMGYLPSVKSKWLDIDQVHFLHVDEPRQSQDL